MSTSSLKDCWKKSKTILITGFDVNTEPWTLRTNIFKWYTPFGRIKNVQIFRKIDLQKIESEKILIFVNCATREDAQNITKVHFFNTQKLPQHSVCLCLPKTLYLLSDGREIFKEYIFSMELWKLKVKHFDAKNMTPFIEAIHNSKSLIGPKNVGKYLIAALMASKPRFIYKQIV